MAPRIQQINKYKIRVIRNKIRNSYTKHMHSIARKIHTFDATNKILGRFASRVANLLIGKVKRTYAPNIDAGDIVIVKNVGKLRFTGQKAEQKEHKWYSGYPGGLKRTRLGKMLAENPQRVLRLAVLRMLPKNKLQKERIKRLRFDE